MLAIRLQRTGRSGHAQFRLIVQESRLNPSSGKVVAQLGNYNPHSKAVVVNKEKASFYLEHGAQPSPRAASLLQKEGVKLPKWVVPPAKKAGKIRNPEKLRKNQPEKPAEVPTEAASEAPAPTEDVVEEAKEEAPAPEAPVEQPAEANETEDAKPAEDEAVEAEPEASEAPATAEAVDDSSSDTKNPAA